MELKELLESLELTEGQVKGVLDGMRANKLYVTGEENIEERYGKLKGQHQQAADQLKEAQALIEEMKKATADNEGLQGKVAEYEQKLAEAEARAEKAERDSAIKVQLLSNGAVPEDVDYLMYRIENGDCEVKLSDDGKLSGMDDALKALKSAHPNNFKAEGGTGRFEGNRLPGGNGSAGASGITQEQFDKMGYHERNKLFNENREAYEALVGRKERS